MDYIEERFGAKTKLAMATYYKNGADHYIPAHQDKRVTVASEGAVETASQIFNIALGAVRPFWLLAPLARASCRRSSRRRPPKR